ncbi:BTB/POZ domain-containing protein At1g67900-like [Aristolochia californica]|uniref:BTB/POZ domain-containing protein At1g67900-like n=1 Tax=Aristolochia californica TaxID=171875 RepID=UPI0035D6A322
MKFMKLGTRPDTFYTAEAVRSVSSEVSSDLVIQVKGTTYLLHKFPLLSKCARLQKLCAEATNPESIIKLPEFPGGVEAFEICAKFCYGITITLSAFNIVAVRCAAEYLEMTEEVEKGNLVYKLDIFLTSCILRGWRDSITTLQSTKAFPLWSQELGITGRCIDAIASKIIAYPSKLNWSISVSARGRYETPCHNGTESQRNKPSSKGWWAEDIAELSIDHYWRIMVAIKSGCKVPANLIGEALQVYARRWLPNMSKNGNKQAPDSCSDSVGEMTSRHRLILESIVSLLPVEKGSVPCSFLFKLLKAANIMGASSSSKMELAGRAGLQLEEATVKDLLIPSLSYANETLYDVDIVTVILEQFMLQGQSPPTSPPREKLRLDRRRRSRSAENVDFEFQESRRSSSASHSSKLKVAKLIDGYLQEIARDENLPLQKVITLAEAIPDFARPEHDDLYKVIDIYLKAHPDLNKSERKRLCRILDCKKLSMEACMHAAQNELLPLRVVVQVLFFEQARVAMAGGQVTELPTNLKALLATHADDISQATQLKGVDATIDDEWSISGLKSPKTKLSTLRMKLAEADSELDEDVLNHDGSGRTSMLKAFCSIPVRPKKMLSKLWSSNRSVSERQ